MGGVGVLLRVARTTALPCKASERQVFFTGISPPYLGSDPKGGLEANTERESFDHLRSSQ